ncbi:MAG: NAD(P)-dependent oxidoreductase [Proteobacteria bacterium]|nr:NAD(P)-dependent oxidoreductase [Pseudomonadota bacterium]
MAKEKLGFIGLGMMGGPMSSNLAKAGHPLVVCDVVDEAAERLVALGAERVATPKEVADQVETVLVSLPTPDVVRMVATGQGGLVEGTKIKRYIDLSTSGAIIAKEVGAALSAKGIRCLDCPVSGGSRGAEAGTLALMVSGAKDLFEDVADILSSIGSAPFYVGAEPGMAQTAKVANNYLSAVANIATAEAMVMGVKAGIEAETLLEIFNRSSGMNRATSDKYPTFVIPRNFKSMRTVLIHKDVNLCVEQAAAMGVPMWLGSQVRQFLQFALTQGHGDDPSIGLIRLIEKWAGVEVKGKNA